MPSEHNEIETQVKQITEIVTEIADSGHRTIGYFTALPVDGRVSRSWSIYWDDEIDDLFAMADYKVAQILSVLGSEVRLAMLRELIKGPRTAAQLTAELKMQTTGQTYHHLKELQRAGYVSQREGGRFHIEMKVARVYVAALALAANAGALTTENEEE